VPQHDAEVGGASLLTNTYMRSQLVILRYEGSFALPKIVEFQISVRCFVPQHDADVGGDSPFDKYFNGFSVRHPEERRIFCAPKHYCRPNQCEMLRDSA